MTGQGPGDVCQSLFSVVVGLGLVMVWAQGGSWPLFVSILASLGPVSPNSFHGLALPRFVGEVTEQTKTTWTIDLNDVCLMWLMWVTA